MQSKIEKLLSLNEKRGSRVFTINQKFRCNFRDSDSTNVFSAWKRDTNSPSEFSCSEHLDVTDISDDSNYNGMIQIQRDPKLNNGKYFATLWLNRSGNLEAIPKKWDRMSVVTELEI